MAAATVRQRRYRVHCDTCGYRRHVTGAAAAARLVIGHRTKTPCTGRAVAEPISTDQEVAR
ncbi:hypothetical protein [Jiangella alba]|uniref:hypothetical protein n=1 Tax=Jiangella alba TaxID=561176 RepID=UPI00083F00D0|nr:hypothetical protein [Jiangella alba]